MRGMRTALRSALAAAVASSAACQSPAYETNWNRLRAGMDHGEVEALLGRPSSTYAPPPPDAAKGERPSAVPMERWQFGDTLSSMATRAMFPDDLYDLTPGSFRDLDPALHEPGLEWGAAKAHVHLARRRAAGQR